MANITSWKINNQVADLRDGTKGLPEGAVPLDSEGRIALSLYKAYAENVPMARNNAMDLITYIGRSFEDIVPPLEWERNSSIGNVACTYVHFEQEHGIVATANNGLKYTNSSGNSWAKLTSVSGVSVVYFIQYINGAWFIGCNSGLFRLEGLTLSNHFIQVFSFACDKLVYDGTTYRALTSQAENKVLISIDGTTWNNEAFFANCAVKNIWYLQDSTWWACADFGLGFILYKLDSGSWQSTTGAYEFIDLVYWDNKYYGITATELRKYNPSSLFWDVINTLYDAHCSFCVANSILYLCTPSGKASYYRNGVFNLCLVDTDYPRMSLIKFNEGVYVSCGDHKVSYSVDGVSFFNVPNMDIDSNFQSVTFDDTHHWWIAGIQRNTTTYMGVYCSNMSRVVLPTYFSEV